MTLTFESYFMGSLKELLFTFNQCKEDFYDDDNSFERLV